MPYRSLTPAKYAAQLARRAHQNAGADAADILAAERGEAPEADSPEDTSPCQWGPMCAGRGTAQITEGGRTYTACDDCATDAATEDATTRTVPLDGGTAVVEHIGDRAEVTVRIGDRLACALILSPAEAETLGAALARPHGVTVGDYWALSDALAAA